MQGEPIHWHELAWTELAERLARCDAAILPVGATEEMPSSGNGREPALEADTVDPEVTSETRSA